MKRKKIIEHINSEIEKLKVSLEENSMENCDDDECPDYDQQTKDSASLEVYEDILKLLQK